MSNLNFIDLKKRLNDLVPDSPFSNINQKLSKYPDIFEKNVRKPLQEELKRITNSEKQ
ncbi:hypothetical protein SAMN05660413_02606 [Salegentibacter flavus]|uniref:Uncharacterized protein n=1 Tax=Salegentibacter flavus TaxID=287099 RepID=A0A1I5BYE5_9FLAO|nr:hypothetical protein SAMN05660413_02606 [Salegentibacter flavus]